MLFYSALILYSRKDKDKLEVKTKSEKKKTNQIFNLITFVERLSVLLHRS